MSLTLIHPQLANCRRLFLRNYLVDVNIGIHDFEKRGAQRMQINVDLYVPLADSSSSRDKIDDVVDYDFIRTMVAKRVAQGHINLQERFVDDIAAALLVHDKVRAVRVSTEKLDVYPDSEGVGVEVFHIKQMG